MVAIGATVLYGMDGVCTVTDITTRTFQKETLEYYVLTPVHDGRSTIYVPTASEAALMKMRPILSADEIRAIIADLPQSACTDWITDENARRAHFKSILLSGDRREIIRMIKTIYLHGQEQKASGRKLHHADEVAMKDAEALLYDEFAYVLGIRPDEVLPFITQELGD